MSCEGVQSVNASECRDAYGVHTRHSKKKKKKSNEWPVVKGGCVAVRWCNSSPIHQSLVGWRWFSACVRGAGLRVRVVRVWEVMCKAVRSVHAAVDDRA